MANKIYEKLKTIIKNNYKFLILLIIILFVFYYEFPYVIYKSGGTINLSDRLEIDTDNIEEGKLQMSYVTTIRGTIPFIILSYILPDWDLVPLKDITDESSYDEALKIGKEYLEEGIDNAIISAFNESNYSIEITKEIIKVIYITKEAHTDISVGDEIKSINNHNVNTFDEIKEYINSLNEGDTVKIDVINNNKEYQRKAKIYKDSDSLKIGVAFHSTYEYKTEVPVKIKMKDNESGSSGGLMMSLAIYNKLTEKDITNGYNIVGTGSIKKNGEVEEIGGVKYKLLGAVKDKAKIFLCPEKNYEEVIKIKNERNLDIEVVSVKTLKDAINYLESVS